MNTTERIWTKEFLFLTLGLLLIAFSNYSVVSSISRYGQLLSNSGLIIGLMTSSFFIGSLFMRLVNGGLVQKFGTYKVMLSGAALFICAYPFQCFANSIALIILRALQGIGFSVFTTAGNVAASCLIPQKRITEGLSYYTLSFVLAMSIAPVLALTLTSSHSAESFKCLFIIGTVFAVSSFFLLRKTKSSKLDNAKFFHVTNDFSLKHLPQTFLGFEKGVFFPFVISFLMTFTYASAIIYLIGLGADRGWMNVGSTFIFYSVGVISTRLFTGRLSDKYGADWIMYPAYLVGIVALLIIAFCTHFFQLCIGMLMLGMFVGAYNPEVMVFCIKRCTKYRRGTATSAFNAAIDSGYAASGIICGLIIHHFGYTYAFTACALIGVVACIIYTLTLSKFRIVKN